MSSSVEKEIAAHSKILAGECHGRRRLTDCRAWGGKDLGTPETTEHTGTLCVQTLCFYRHKNVHV